MTGSIVSINVSPERGTKKKPVPEAEFLVEEGIATDGHRGEGHRQISLLAEESADKIRQQGLAVGPGDFAENLTTRGIRLLDYPIGSRLAVGETVLLEVTQIGKECHHGCEIARATGNCVMPTEGIFCRVLRGGTIRVGDPIGGTKA